MSETTVAPNNKTIAFRGRPQREKPRTGGFGMPWTGQEFGSRHNHAASPAQAASGARQANAMLRSGVPEGIAIATANKRIAKMRKRGVISPKQHAKMADKYGGEDQQPINASSR